MTAEAHAVALPRAAATNQVPSWVDRTAYPFTPRRLSLPAGQASHDVSYVDQGAGEPILFVHGTPTWSFEYRHVIGALSASHRCIAPDHLGFGLSQRPADFDYRPESHAQVLAQFVDRLGLDRFTLVVHDYGGPIGLPLALDRPDRVRRLVVLNSWMWSIAGDPRMARGARMLGGRLGRFLYRRANLSLRTLMPYAYGDRKRLTPGIHRQYLAAFPDADSRGRVLWPLARGLLASSAHFDSLWQRRQRLAEIPALILWGLRDRALGPDLLTHWRTALPHARVVELPDAGHWPHEEQPERVIEQMQAFL
jgi:haloalkane dehalogenase